MTELSYLTETDIIKVSVETGEFETDGGAIYEVVEVCLEDYPTVSLGIDLDSEWSSNCLRELAADMEALADALDVLEKRA